MATRRQYSRLSRKEGKRYIRQSALLTVLTILLLIALLFWGIPSLIKLAIFLGDLRSSTQPITGEDVLPPPPPVIQPVAEATNSAVLELSGFAEEGSTVVLSLNGSDAYETLVDSGGEFLFDSVKLDQGDNAIFATSTDTAGNKSKASSTTTVVLDQSLPTLSVDAPQDGQAFYGPMQKVARVSGRVDPGSTVLVNNSFVILSQEGVFSYLVPLNEGDNIIAITAQDRAGNQVQKEIKVSFAP